MVLVDDAVDSSGIGYLVRRLALLDLHLDNAAGVAIGKCLHLGARRFRLAFDERRMRYALVAAFCAAQPAAHGLVEAEEPTTVQHAGTVLIPVLNELANAVPLVVLVVVAFEGEGGPDALPSAL